MFFIGLLLSVLFLLTSCEKKDPKPELKDSIYQDMLGQQAEAERIIKETETKIEDIKKSLGEAAPQTGMRERAERQIFEMKKLKDKLEQQKVYWKLRTFERLKYVRLKAGHQADGYKQDPNEWDVYNSEKKLRMAKNAWDLKARFKETGFDYDPVLMGENPADAPKKTPSPPAGGGH